MLVVMALPTLSQAVELIDVRYSDTVDNQLKLEFIFDSNVVKPKTNIIADPTQLVFDFVDVGSQLELSDFPLNSSGVKHLMIKANSAGLNIAIFLDQLVEYQQQVQGNKYIVILGDKASTVPAAQSSYTSARIEPVKADSLNKINTIDFKLNADNNAELKIIFDNSSLAASVVQKGRKLEVKLIGSGISDDDLYTMDVMDFATPVASFETFRENNGSRFVVKMIKDFSYDWVQQGNEFKLTVKAPKAKNKQTSVAKKVVYKGKKLSLNFQKVAIRTALQIIADYNDFNLVTGDNVKGDITLRLESVPWDQALDMILRLKGLDKRIEGNILLVAPAEELLQREASELKATQVVEDLVPLYSEYLQINYAKAKDIAQLLDGGKAKLLSTRGSVAVDQRTNMLLVQDTAKKLDEVRRLVKVLDIPVRQVVIEARIVTVTDNVNEEFGIRWGVTNTISDGSISGSLEGTDSASAGVIPSLSDRLNVNLPVTEPAGTIAFQVAKLGDGTLLDLELSALERENKGEVIARPSITTANQQAAYIEQGTEIPYVSASSSGATTVEFKQAVLALRVTPQITPDNRIILDLIITQDTRGETVKTGLGEAVAIDTQEIGTKVLVDNGETIVLGGIYQQQLIKSVTKVPVFGDLPLVGWLFRTQKNLAERRELLIFVTPRIVIDRKRG
jgi:type IV pilus assembly protein PilQ